MRLSIIHDVKLKTLHLEYRGELSGTHLAGFVLLDEKGNPLGEYTKRVDGFDKDLLAALRHLEDLERGALFGKESLSTEPIDIDLPQV